MHTRIIIDKQQEPEQWAPDAEGNEDGEADKVIVNTGSRTLAQQPRQACGTTKQQRYRHPAETSNNHSDTDAPDHTALRRRCLQRRKTTSESDTHYQALDPALKHRHQAQPANTSTIPTRTRCNATDSDESQRQRRWKNNHNIAANGPSHATWGQPAPAGT
jgi:hypothetical protein